MPRIRTIKPSFWGSRKIAAVPLEARLLAVGLISFQDDKGRFLASITAIKGYVFPNDDALPDAKVKRWLADLERSGFVTLYEVDGIRYGQVDVTEQRINRPQPSNLPAPPPDYTDRFTHSAVNGSRAS